MKIMGIGDPKKRAGGGGGKGKEGDDKLQR